MVPKAAFPFLLSLRLRLTLLFTPLQSQQPSCCQPGIHFTWFSHSSLPSFSSSFYYCLIKENSMYFNKMAVPYPNSQSFSIFLILLYFLPSTFHLLSCVFVYCMFSPFRIRVSWRRDFCVHCYNLEQGLISSHHLCNEGKRCKNSSWRKKKRHLLICRDSGARLSPNTNFWERSWNHPEGLLKKSIF